MPPYLCELDPYSEYAGTDCLPLIYQEISSLRSLRVQVITHLLLHRESAILYWFLCALLHIFQIFEGSKIYLVHIFPRGLTSEL